MEAPHSSLAADIGQIANEPVDVGERAQLILEAFGRAVPDAAASISVRDPERRGRYALADTGELLTEDASRPALAERDLMDDAVRAMADAVDRMRTIRAASRVVRDAVAGVVLTRGGNTLPLDGRPHGRLLTAGSPVLVEAAERLDAGDAYATFLHPCPGDGTTGALTRISVLDCRGEDVDHLRGIVLVSPAPDLRGLTHRELQILGLVVAGRLDEQIAVALGTTRADVAGCIGRSMSLLAAPSRPGLAVRALREGLYFPERVSRDAT
jgi:DNA-binding CsgD family transcriptional regulator